MGALLCPPLTFDRVGLRGILIAQKIIKIETQEENYTEIRICCSKRIFGGGQLTLDKKDFLPFLHLVKKTFVPPGSFYGSRHSENGLQPETHTQYVCMHACDHIYTSTPLHAHHQTCLCTHEHSSGSYTHVPRRYTHIYAPMYEWALHARTKDTYICARVYL